MVAGKSEICRADVQVPPQSQCPSLKASRQENCPYLGGGSAFCSIQDFKCLDEAHLHYRGQCALRSLQISMIISSHNTLPETPRITFDQVLGHPMAQFS